MPGENEVLVSEVKELTANVKNLMPKAEQAESLAKSANEAAQAATRAVEEIKSTAKVIADHQAEEKKAREEQQKFFDELATEMKMMKENRSKAQEGEKLGFKESFANLVKDNSKEIAEAAMGRKASFEMKAATTMTTSGDLSGSPMTTYIPTPALLPPQKVNFRDLVPSFQSATESITLFRERRPSPVQGAIAAQTTEGLTKAQLEYAYDGVVYTAMYISGFVRIAKQMLRNLLWLQTALPQQLLRDFFIAENTRFATLLGNEALASTSTTGGNDAEKFIDYMTNIMANNFDPNGIVTTPAVWGELMKTTVPSIGTSYSVPGGFYIDPRTGRVAIAGVPVLPTTWVGAGKAFVGDWTQASIAQVENLKVEFFEEDSDNVQRNLITVRVEALEVLVVEQPYAFSNPSGL
jgi:HK97 family phage major capsid protein